MNKSGPNLRSVIWKRAIIFTAIIFIGLTAVSLVLWRITYFNKMLDSRLYPFSLTANRLRQRLDETSSLFNLWLNAPSNELKQKLLINVNSSLPSMIKQLKLQAYNDNLRKNISETQRLYKKFYWRQWQMLDHGAATSREKVALRFQSQQLLLFNKIEKNLVYLSGRKNNKALALENYKRLVQFYHQAREDLLNANLANLSRLSKLVAEMSQSIKKIKGEAEAKKAVITLLNRYLQLVRQQMNTNSAFTEELKIKEIDEKYLPALSRLMKKINFIINANKQRMLQARRYESELIILAFSLLLLGLLISLVLSFVFIKQISAIVAIPLEEVTELIRKQARKIMAQPIKKKYPYEMAELIDAFNYMVDQKRGYIEKLKSNQHQLAKQANYDQITGLMNQHFFKTKFEELHSKKELKKEVFIYLKLQGLGRVSYLLGEASTTAVIKSFANILQDFIGDKGLSARLSGSSFIFYIPVMPKNLCRKDYVRDFSNFLQKVFSESRLCYISNYAVGIKFLDGQRDGFDAIIAQTSFAAYSINENSFTRIQQVTDNVKKQFDRKQVLERDIITAVEKKQLYLVYQPQYNINEEKLMGCEALIRWQHPDLGLISPLEFIPIAERCGIILQFSDFIQKTAFSTYKKWREKFSLPFKLSINASLLELLGDSYCHDLLNNMKSFDLPPDCLEIEITESLMDLNNEEIWRVVARLKGFGLSVAIDDFGTGYSSLKRLSDLPFDLVKIDKSFIDDLATFEKSKRMLVSIIHMAKSLGAQTIAEGVETNEQLHILKQLGCDYIQGFVYSKPLNQGDFFTFLKSNCSNF
jgi:EAL domain-containing protein (putative c-di-GMP-specific phosphodiesterase class I)/GGDEF domain-containing protein